MSVISLINAGDRSKADFISAVHLMGNYLDQFPNEYDSDSDSEFDSEEEDDYEGLGLDEISDEEDEDVPVVA